MQRLKGRTQWPRNIVLHGKDHAGMIRLVNLTIAEQARFLLRVLEIHVASWQKALSLLLNANVYAHECLRSRPDTL